MNRRVVVTGMGGVTALGSTWREIAAALRAGRSGVKRVREWEDITGLNTKLGAPIVDDVQMPERFKRKKVRGMGRVAMLAVRATENALLDSGIDASLIASGLTGVAYGSSAGSVGATMELGKVLIDRTTASMNSTSYVRMMPHTTAVNVSLSYHTKGRIIPTSCACVSGSLAIGYAYEAVKHGYQNIMLAGGADELDVTEAAVFDVLYATSSCNDSPQSTPRPFDVGRDGLVIGEGAATLVLEELESARARQAPIIAEIIGFGTNSDGNHVTQPTQETMEAAMQLALKEAAIPSSEIGYCSAHAAATFAGDSAESHACAKVLGDKVPISSLKGNFGHTLGACGAIEVWLALNGLREGWFPPTHNLSQVDPQCADLEYLIGQSREIDCEHIISNNFAFGGMNTSLVFKKPSVGAR